MQEQGRRAGKDLLNHKSQEAIAIICHGGSVCLHHVMAFLIEEGIGVPRNMRALFLLGAAKLFTTFPPCRLPPLSTDSS